MRRRVNIRIDDDGEILVETEGGWRGAVVTVCMPCCEGSATQRIERRMGANDYERFGYLTKAVLEGARGEEPNEGNRKHAAYVNEIADLLIAGTLLLDGPGSSAMVGEVMGKALKEAAGALHSDFAA